MDAWELPMWHLDQNTILLITHCTGLLFPEIQSLLFPYSVQSHIYASDSLRFIRILPILGILLQYYRSTSTGCKSALLPLQSSLPLFFVVPLALIHCICCCSMKHNLNQRIFFFIYFTYPGQCLHPVLTSSFIITHVFYSAFPSGKIILNTKKKNHHGNSTCNNCHKHVIDCRCHICRCNWHPQIIKSITDQWNYHPCNKIPDCLIYRISMAF